MKAGWEVKPLEQCLDKFRVAAKIPRKKFDSSGRFPIISQEAEFINGYWNDENDVCQIDRPVVIFGDHTQVLKYVDFNFVVGADGVKVLNPKTFLNPKFLQYFIEANPFPSLGYARHFRHVKSLPIPLPPLEEQKRIVAVLDSAFDALTRAHVEANLLNARELFESIIRRVFQEIISEFECNPIGTFADHSLGKMLDKSKNKGEFRPYLRNVNVRWFAVDTDDVSEMRIQETEEKRYSVEKGDLLICEGGYPGRASIWNSDEPIFFQKALHRVRFPNLEMNKLLMYYLFYLDAVGEFRQYCSGTGIQHFTGAALAKLPFPNPPIEVVTKAVEVIENNRFVTNEASVLYQQKLTDLDELRQSLLQKAFAGELT